MRIAYWDRIEEAMGPAALALLIEKWGGKRLYVPHLGRLRGEHKLIASLGQATAEALARVAGGGYLYVLKKGTTVKRVRNAQIVEAYRTETPVGSLARDHSLTERRIYQIVTGKAPKAPTPKVVQEEWR